MAEMIECPKCGTKIEVTQALSAQLSGRLREEFALEMGREKEKVEREMSKLRKKEEELTAAAGAVGERIKEGVLKERAVLEQQAKVKAKEELAQELSDRDAQLQEMRVNLRKSQEKELALLKRERELKDKAEAAEIEFTRKVNEMSDLIKAEARKQALTEHKFKDAEKDKRIGDLLEQIDALKLKAEQGSQQLQGEVQELALEELLRAKFPKDAIEPVGKGVRGADVLQVVSDVPGVCGSILWESKRTRNWSEGWLEKLREDQRGCNAAVAILVTGAMPESCDTFELIEGIWVTNWACAVGLAMALRAGLVEIARTNRALVGKQEKAEILYDYLASPSFRNRVSGIVEAFSGLKADLDQEKRAMQKMWAKREKQLEMAITSTTRMYGDLQGIIGAQLPEIEQLALPGGEE